MSDPQLVVILEITDDLPIGEPQPPVDPGNWSVAHRENGRTTWRALTLQAAEDACRPQGGDP